MTTPGLVQADPDALKKMLSLVDTSRMRSTSAEDQFASEMAQIYTPLQSPEDSSDEGAPALTAALLAAGVSVLRRAFASGQEEGQRFAEEQVRALDLPTQTPSPTNPQLAPSTSVIDAMVQDYLQGQVDLAKEAGPDVPDGALGSRLARRADLGVTAAFQAGRGQMTEHTLRNSVGHLSGQVNKMWVSRFDMSHAPCSQCLRLHGMHVGLDQDFPVPTSEPAPYLNALSTPPRHPKCKCSIVLYLPLDAAQATDVSGPSPLSMALYADQVLKLSGSEDRNDFVSATMVYVKPYNRTVDGKLQFVNGYYFDVHTGLKIPISEIDHSAPIKQVSEATAHMLEHKAKSVAPGVPNTKHKWAPGTYEIHLPGNNITQTLVHHDGTSSNLFNDKMENATVEKTSAFLDYWDAKGAVHLVSGSPKSAHDPFVHTPLEPSPVAKAAATLPHGSYKFASHPKYSGIHVHEDGTGSLHFKGSPDKTKVSAKGVQDVAKGNLGKFHRVEDDSHIEPEWTQHHEAAKAADKLPDHIAVAEHPKNGPGQTLEKQALFDIGDHKVAFPEGSQIYRSGSSKDTLYVLTHDGNVTKYNPQGQGVQATIVASSENPAARADLLSKLDNVSSEGVHVSNSYSVPGASKVYLGNANLNSTQIDNAIGTLESSTSPKIVKLLGDIGSPLATEDVHAIAAPYKAFFNNKTKPAFIHALKLALDKADPPPIAAAGPVSHLEEEHGLKDHHANLGSSDHTAIHDALHAIDDGVDHNHNGSGPGLIDLYGTPYTPEHIASAIEALKAELSTSVKSPLKKTGNPLSNSKYLAEIAAEGGPKLHYSKFKPALIKALQNVLDKHQKTAPPAPAVQVAKPEPQELHWGVYGTKAQLLEARDFFESIDFSKLKTVDNFDNEVSKGPASNPFIHGVDWWDVADGENPDGTSLLSTINQDVHSALDKAIGSEKKLPKPEVPAVALPKEEPSVEVPQIWTGSKSVPISEIQSAINILELHHDTNALPKHGVLTPSVAKDAAESWFGSFYDPQFEWSDLSTQFQKLLDESGHSKPDVPTSAELVIEGKKFTKEQLLHAADLLKKEKSTSVKSPLKTDLPDLAKTDLKAFAEAHAGTHLHYSKFKPALIKALEEKAHELSDTGPGAPAPESVVTKVGKPEPELEPTSLEKDIAKSESKVDYTGTWVNSMTGLTFFVHKDGSGEFTLGDGSEAQHFNLTKDQVNVTFAPGTEGWKKISDSTEDHSKPSINGVFVGKHSTQMFGGHPLDIYVMPDATVAVHGPQGWATTKLSKVTTQIQTGSKSFEPLKEGDVPQWILDLPKHDGLSLGEYKNIHGMEYHIDKQALLDGQDHDEFSLHSSVSAGNTALKDPSAVAKTPVHNGLYLGKYYSSSSNTVVDYKGDSLDYGNSVVNDPVMLSKFKDEVLFDESLVKLGKYEDPEYPGSSLVIDPSGTATYDSGDGVTFSIHVDDPNFVEKTHEFKYVSDWDGPWPLPPKDEQSSVPAMLAYEFKLDPLANKHVYFEYMDKPALLSLSKQWAKDTGLDGVVGQHLSTKSKSDLVSWANAFYSGDWAQAYQIEASGVKKHKGGVKHPGSPDHPDNVNGFTKKVMAPAVPGEIPAGLPVKGTFPLEHAHELVYGFGTNWTPDLVDSYLVAANMQNPTGLTSAYKRYWVFGHVTGDKLKTDAYSLKAQTAVLSGEHKSEPILPDVEKYAPGMAVPQDPGWPQFDPTKAAATEWTALQVDKYLSHLGSKAAASALIKQPLDTKQMLVQLHHVASLPSGTQAFKEPGAAKTQLTDFLTKFETDVQHQHALDVSEDLKNLLKIKEHTYTKDALQPHLGGSSATLIHVTDEKGKKYLFKVAPEPFRADAEHGGHLLAGMSGLQVADSQLGKFDGQFGQYQSKLDSKSMLHGVSPQDLPLSALKDVMRSHVFDWATQNDDSHSGNFLLSPDGQHVIPVDIARVFAEFGGPSMKLKRGQLSTRSHVFYEDVYKAMMNKTLSESDTDALYQDMMHQAKRMAAIPDDAYSGVLQDMFARRKNFHFTTASNADDLIKQALARKNALAEDFDKFWDSLYSEMGREKPKPATSISEHVFTGNSPDWHTKAASIGAGGAASFFAGTHLEDGHLLGQVVEKNDSAKNLEFWASGQVRPDADGVLRDWLASHTEGGVKSGPKEDASQEVLSKLGLSNIPGQILDAAKTISHHHKQGDKNYNTQKLASFDVAKTVLKNRLDEVSTGNWPSVVPEVDRQHYKSMLLYYQNQVDEVDRLKNIGGVSEVGQFDPFKFKLSEIKKTVHAPNNPLGIKVVQRSAGYESGHLDFNTGSLSATGSHEFQRGTEFVATLPDGSQIEYKSHNKADGIPLSQRGSLRIKVRKYDGSSGSAEPVMEALRHMGLDLSDADEYDMELFYWRHLFGILNDRSDGNFGKFSEIKDKVKSEINPNSDGSSSLSSQDEVEKWREAWSLLDAAKLQKFVASRGYLPQFSHPNLSKPEEVGGQPYWNRFDVDMDELAKSDKQVGHNVSTKLSEILRSGGLYSTEDRTKVLGQWMEGMSSSSDQDKGSANFIFTRLGGPYTYGSFSIYLRPEVLARTSNYAFDGDYFGNIHSRKTAAHFDFEKATNKTGGSNETMIKHGVTLLDDMDLVSFHSELERNNLIKTLHGMGIYAIRGLPLEDRLVLAKDVKDALEKIKEARKQAKPVGVKLPG